MWVTLIDLGIELPTSIEPHNAKTGHFYLGENRTFLFSVDIKKLIYKKSLWPYISIMSYGYALFSFIY